MDSTLIAAGIAAALGAAGYVGSRPSASVPKAPRGARQGRRSQSRPSTGISGFQPTNRGDLSVRPPQLTNVPRGVPRNVASLWAWDTVKFDTSITLSTTAVTETNFSFNLTQHPQQTSWTALFDQWTIPQVSVAFMSGLPPGSTGGPSVLHTALDFDNITNISTVAAIEDFSTCNSVAMQPQTRFVRSVRPSCRTYNSAGTVALVVGPSWVDSAVPSTTFFGIRSIAGTSGNVYAIQCTVTIWFCFRNQI
jgi:hypothetical protein